MSWNNFIHEGTDMKDFETKIHNLKQFIEFLMN
jgi:hypothetical protein